jgi:hypothetical protein
LKIVRAVEQHSVGFSQALANVRGHALAESLFDFALLQLFPKRLN